VYYTPTGTDFAPKEVTVTVTNTGNRATGSLRAQIRYEDGVEYNEWGLFELVSEKEDVTSIDIPDIAPGRTAQFTVAIDPTEFGKEQAGLYAVTINVGNTTTGYKDLPLKYGAYNFTSDDITFTRDGAAVERLEIGGPAGIIAVSTAKTDELKWFSGNPAVAAINETSGELTLVGSGITFIGLIDWETMEVSGKKTFVFPQNYQPSQVTAIALDGDNPRKLVLTYTEVMSSDSGFTGFTLTGSTTGLAITGVMVETANPHWLALALNKVPAESELDALVLSYEYPSNGGEVKDQFDTPVTASLNEDTVTLPITVTQRDKFARQVAVVSATIDGAAAKDKVVVTFNEPVTATSGGGFSITGSATATAFTTAVTIDPDDNKKLVLTLNLRPDYNEIDALKLGYNASQGNVKNASNDAAALALASFSNQTITVTGFDPADGRPSLVGVFIDAKRNPNTGEQDAAASAENAKKVYVTFNKAMEATNSSGFSISGSSTAQYFESAVAITTVTVSNDTVVLTLNEWPSQSEDGSVMLSYDSSLGNVKDTTNGTAQSFTDQIIRFDNHTLGENVDTIKPWLVSATVENATPSIVRVVFSEPVTVTAAQFQIKVNSLPSFDLGGLLSNTDPHLDKSSTLRDVSSAAAVGGSSSSATWDLTMDAPAGYGEILRLATTAAGAAVDPANNQLPQIPQFIMRNLVKRVKEAYEANVGVYRNGVTEPDVDGGAAGDKLFENAMRRFATDSSSNANKPAAGNVIVMVLGQDQTYEYEKDSFTSNDVPTNWRGTANKCTVIITTPTGNTNNVNITFSQSAGSLISRNNITLIIDDHIILKRAAGETATKVLVGIMDGGKVILDGGEIRDNQVTNNSLSDNNAYAGGIRMGGGSWGSYFIMNGGKITNNSYTTSSTSTKATLAGGLGMFQYVVFVMHGGEISNNTVTQSAGNAGTPRGGGIATLHYNTRACSHNREKSR
jgi:hypothetical protein